MSAPAQSLSPPSVPPEPLLRQSGISLHILDDSGLLFRSATRQLFAMNAMATFLWCLLEDGVTAEGMAAELQTTFGLDAATASACRSDALGQWRRHGLLMPPGDHSGLTAGPYRLLDLRFSLQVQDRALHDQLASLLAPLAMAEPEVSPDGEPLKLAIDGLTMLCGERIVEQCREANGVVPMVKAGLVRLALDGNPGHLAVHAAALRLGDACLLLPGPSGSGKSTLAAALAGAGCGLLADDTAVLAPDTAAGTAQIRPLPFAICLKPGSWALLQTRFPQIADLPVHRRADGKLARYLLPPDRAGWIDAASRHPVRWIVFPRRRPSGRTRLAAIPRAEALSRLLRESCPLGRGLDAATVSALAAWMRDIACFDLHYEEVGAAVDTLRRLAP